MKMRTNFGKGKTRCGSSNLFKDNKTGKMCIWKNGKWIDVTGACQEIDEILGYLYDEPTEKTTDEKQ